MRKILKTIVPEQDSKGNFIRYNIPPMDFPEDTVFIWLGQNDEFGVVEVISDNEAELEEAILLGNGWEEMDLKTPLISDLVKEKMEIDNINYSHKRDKAVALLNRYGNK